MKTITWTWLLVVLGAIASVSYSYYYFVWPVTVIHPLEPGSTAEQYIEEFEKTNPNGLRSAPDGSAKIEQTCGNPQHLNTCCTLTLVPVNGPRQQIIKASGDSSMGVDPGWSRDLKAIFLRGNAAIDCRDKMKTIRIIFTLTDGKAWEIPYQKVGAR